MSFSNKIKAFFAKSREKHKLSFTHDTTYEEKWSLRLSSLNLASLFIVYAFIIIIILSLLIKYTPLNYFFTDKYNSASITEVNENRAKIDSLYNKANSTQLYLEDLMKILRGEKFNDSLGTMESDTTFSNYHPRFEKSAEDSLLRLKIERGEKPDAEIHYDFFFTPTKGTVSQGFNSKKGHYGVDVVTLKGEPIKSCLEGTVIYAGWTPDDGEIIMVQHSNDFTSVYKHCSTLLKNIGDRVQTGDPIAIVGNSGKHTSGPHLHFELWKSGVALNPQELINFSKYLLTYSFWHKNAQ